MESSRIITLIMKAKHKKPLTNTGSASGDLFLVATVVIILGVIWSLGGGATRTNTNNQSDTILGKSTFFSVENFFIPNISRGGDNTKSESDKEYDEIIKEYGRTRDFGETSPHWGLITIKKHSNGPKQTSANLELITLEASYKLDESLNITGWKLQSMISNTIVSIGEATKVSTSGEVNIESNIILSPKDKIHILTGHSPIGTSFQVNKCSGYFEQFQNFTPSLSKECPLAEDEFKFAESDPFRFGDECLSYIENISRCIMPLDALPIGFSDSCTLFITEKINYSSCIKNHREDEDFFKPEWRVYLKHDQEIWGTRDIIRLLDNNGKTVDVFSY